MGEQLRDPKPTKEWETFKAKPAMKNSEHIIDGEFQSDKYPDTPRGLIPFKATDPVAQPFLWAYAQRRREVDAVFADDLEWVLRKAGYEPPAMTEQSALAALLECGCSHVLAQHPDGVGGVCTAGNPREHESPEWKLCYCNEFDSERDDSWRWQRFALTEAALTAVPARNGCIDHGIERDPDCGRCWDAMAADEGRMMFGKAAAPATEHDHCEHPLCGDNLLCCRCLRDTLATEPVRSCGLDGCLWPKFQPAEGAKIEGPAEPPTDPQHTGS